jgi:hypothetical protein
MWGPAEPFNIRPIQSFQNIALRILTGAPKYITNISLREDLQIRTISDLAKIHYNRDSMLNSTRIHKKIWLLLTLSIKLLSELNGTGIVIFFLNRPESK